VDCRPGTPEVRGVKTNSLPIVETLEDRRLLTVFTVTTTADSGTGSLRWAINASNNTPGVDTIAFDITSADKVIRPTSALPAIYDAAIVNGATQPGYAGKPLIQIDGGEAGSGVDGIKLYGNDTLIGLSITGFSGQGVTTIPRTDVKYGGNVIQDNWIGLNLAGQADGNGLHDIGLYSTGNVVGGPRASERNVLGSSTGGDGVWIMGGIFGGSNGDNTVENNLIGVDPTGTAARPNINGIGIQNSPSDVILNNIISGNSNDGIVILGTSTGVIIRGNRIGTDATGTLSIANQWYGIEQQASGGVIGGTLAAQRNIISGNGEAGIVFYQSGSSGNLVEGNYIGTDITGDKALGNGQQGICFSGAAGNVIGGSAAGAGNVIAANGDEGIGIFPGSGEVVQGNRIGVAANGKALGNASFGIDVINGSSNCIIGGVHRGQGNIIADNGETGVWIGDGTPVLGNTIYGNGGDGVAVSGGTGTDILDDAIYSNGGLAIDLGFNGPTPNHTGGVSGPNNFQNFPLITNAAQSSTAITLSGTFNSAPNSAFTLDFYGAAAAKDGMGQAQFLIGTITVRTDSKGNASFNSTFALTLPARWIISGTATDTNGNTSEFSPAVAWTLVTTRRRRR
jgi:titin